MSEVAMSTETIGETAIMSEDEIFSDATESEEEPDEPMDMDTDSEEVEPDDTTRHQMGIYTYISLKDLLRELGYGSVPASTRKWLRNVALAGNPKVDMNERGYYMFKPKYNVRTSSEFMKLLVKHVGQGPVLYDEVLEGFPQLDKAIASHRSKIFTVTRQSDNSRLLYYNEIRPGLVDDHFKALWRSISVAEIDDRQIVDYLGDQGMLQCLRNPAIKRSGFKRPNSQRKRPARKIRDNRHVEGMLNNYM